MAKYPAYRITPSLIADVDVGPDLKFNIPAPTPDTDTIAIQIVSINGPGTIVLGQTVTFGTAGGDVQTAQNFVDAINALEAAGSLNVKAKIYNILGQDYVWLRGAKDTKYVQVIASYAGVEVLNLFSF